MAGEVGRRSVVMLGTFGLRPKGTMSARALPLAEALTRRGWRVTLVLPPWDWPADAGRRERIAGVEVVNVGLTGGPALIVGRMLAAARAERPALIHCFKPKGYGGLTAAALRLTGWPLVVDNDDWEGPGGWNDRVDTYSPLQRLIFAWQARSLPRQAHSLTVGARTLYQQALAMGRQPAQVHYVPNGLSAWRYGAWQPPADRPAARAALGLGDEPVALLYTRFDVVTPARVVAILAALRAALPDSRLLIVGQGLAGEDEQVRRLAQAAGLATAIHWAGFVPFERLASVLGVADVALYPIDDSLINRSKAPMKLLELVGLGLPVVAEDVGEVREYLEAGNCGRLVKQGDHGRLAAAVAELVRSPAEGQRLGHIARQRAWRVFNWETLVEEVEAAYRQAVGGGRSAERRTSES